ncbi:DUF4124 domain-containing protein [Telluria mixta]|uniref:DUF4124 domain-containing protein n=1 Tax=Telluria mixta TaxID=34071 RepID=A0ABT2C400_9BURK|nr:DUF4124 domain-containing protein [Telluria mixta]MCS0632123.1 DUF4124 domain-containing protein [Telluria mixta]WEM95203.1 DUF4124 domain-containing protein [Telluria mixta]
MMRFLPLLAACLLTNALADPVYKCTQDGKTSYSDRPCVHGKSVELPPPVGIRPEGAESVATQDARTLVELEKLRIAREKEQERIAKADARQARAAATHRKQCARLNLRKRWAEEDVARLTGRAKVAAQRRAKRATEALAVECPA